MDGRLGDLGEFCWMDIKTRDLQGTAARLSAEFGWEVEGRRVGVRGRAVGGVSDLADPVYPAGTPEHVAYYIAVERVEELVGAAVAGGGRVVVEPFGLGERGRIATLVDPVGAAFSLWEGAEGWGPVEAGVGVPVGMVLGCGRPEEARRFYRDVLGVPLRCAEFRREGVAVPRWEAVVRGVGGDVRFPSG
ncbi:VOC family protein [Streptomyces sp. ST1015]|uniref:VOC family protein n=1 Tax=unclassified Streptomyces TaxID=2593676 RepID=UPI001CA6267C|nr:VOC family protein [Streptomyces sp. ST1015]QZZ27450.1 VOC family protein [Streptomyces sp. ST1015]